MANANQVTLTFAGDSSDLERSMDRVGGSSKEMGKETGRGFDRAGEAADDLDTRAMGFRDTMTGVQDTMMGTSQIAEGNLFEGFLTLGMGIGDLASGVANFGVQIAKTAGQFIANVARMAAAHAVQAARMAAQWLIAMGPVGIAIAAIAAVIAILASLGVGFDDVANVAQAAWDLILGLAQGAWNWISENWPLLLAILTGPFGIAVLVITRHWDTIKDAVGGALGWIGDRATDAKNWVVGQFNSLVGFVTGLPGRIWSAAAGMWDGITSAFRSAINSLVEMWNGFSITLGPYTLGGQSTPLGDLPSATFGPWTLDTPNVPYLAEGGIVDKATLAMIGEGGPEAVVPLSKMAGMGGGDVHIHVQGSVLSDRDLVRVIRDEFRSGGFRGLVA